MDKETEAQRYYLPKIIDLRPNLFSDLGVSHSSDLQD